MANNDHIAQLKNGVDTWNVWRNENPDIHPDLTEANLSGANLKEANLERVSLDGADLSRANLYGAELFQAKLKRANLSDADLQEARLPEASLVDADLSGANLSGARLKGAKLSAAKLDRAMLFQARLFEANLSGAQLRQANLMFAQVQNANLVEADLIGANFARASLQSADLRGADLSEARFQYANLSEANLSGARLHGADLHGASLLGADLTGADLSGCRIHGISTWRMKLDSTTKQQNLVITGNDEPTITVDNIEVAQFVYLLLHNQKIREVIDTITFKAVLILGRFTDERKLVLDALREELRKRDYLPIFFDFEKHRSRDRDATITPLARMVRFVIADVSDAKTVLQELRAIVADLPSLPVQPIIHAIQEEPGMFDFYRNRPSFLMVYRYSDEEQLLSDISDKVIRPAELKVLELRS